MARNNMTIVIKVKDNATAQIKAIEAALKGLGGAGKIPVGDPVKQEEARNRKLVAFRMRMNAQRLREETKLAKDVEKVSNKSQQQTMLKTAEAAKKSMIDMTQFNKTMFTTAAFVGLFTKAFGAFADSLKQASELDRLDKEYQRIFGDSGVLIKNIEGFTTTAVDKMEAMRSAIALGQLGIAKNSTQAADIISMAATAAKMAGKDSSEGIEKVTEALKTGSLSGLEFLNELRTSDPALKAYLETLNRAGGALGGAMTAQAKYNLIFNVLRMATKDHLKDARDLEDVLKATANNFNNLKMNIGRLLGTAMIPFIDKISTLAEDIGSFIDRLRTTDKTFPSFIRNIVLTVASLSSFVATAGTLRLLIKGLSSLGIGGVPLLAFGFLSLGQIFGQADVATQSLMETFKSFGSVAAGVMQLVQSFIMDPENFAKGIGKMDRSLHDFLQKKGLLNITTTIAQFGAAVVQFSINVGSALENFYKNYLKPVIDGFEKLTGIHFGPMSRGMLGDSKKGNTAYNAAVNTAAIGIAVVAAKSIFGGLSKIPFLGNLGTKLISPVITKIPFIGKMFDKDSNRPKGTVNDPVYVTGAGFSAVLSETGIGNLPAVGGFTTALEAAITALSSPLGFTATIIGLSGLILGDVALERQRDQEQTEKDTADRAQEKFEARVSDMFPGMDKQGFPLTGSAFKPSPYVQAYSMTTANIPEPLTSNATDELSQDIREMSDAKDTAQIKNLVGALHISQQQKAGLRKTLATASLEDFIYAFETALNKSRLAKKPATHANNSRRPC